MIDDKTPKRRWLAEEDLQAGAGDPDEPPLLKQLREAPVSTTPLTAKQRADFERAKTSTDWARGEDVMGHLAAREAGEKLTFDEYMARRSPTPEQSREVEAEEGASVDHPAVTAWKSAPFRKEPAMPEELTALREAQADPVFVGPEGAAESLARAKREQSQ